MRLLGRVSHLLAVAEGIGIVVCLFSLIILASWQCIERNLSQHHIPFIGVPPWIDGVIRHSVFMIGFLGGAYAAYLQHDKTEPLWHREFSPKGIRPTLVAAADKTLIAWYEDSRLKLAELGRDGLGKASVLARVNGFQPEPDVTRGEKPGQWLVAFRDYESAHFEAFGLRAECK